MSELGEMKYESCEPRMGKCHDEFDVYFARAKLDEELAKEQAAENGGTCGGRRGSLPDATLTIEIPSNHRRALSCKLPSRKRSKKSKKEGSPKSKESSPPSNYLEPQPIHHSSSSHSVEGGVSMNYVTEPTLRAPSPRNGSSAQKCQSAPHSRSSSWKNQRRPKSSIYARDTSEQSSPEHDRSRNSSITRFEEDVASKLEELKLLQAGNSLVVRNFSLSSKGVINRGDSFKRKPAGSAADAQSPQATPANTCAGQSGVRDRQPSCASQESAGACSSPPTSSVARVLVIGDRGVGKTALLQQFMTSQYMGAAETSFDDECGKMVTVMVNAEETIMDFIDVPVESDLSQYGEVDGYLLVFSITSKPSFYYVKEILENLSSNNSTRHLACILVANKGDLVRNRSVSENDPRSACVKYGCKYSEVSAVLNHNIDELLVGLVTQLRLNTQRAEKQNENNDLPKNVSCISAKNLLHLIFRKNTRTSHSCDNLLSL